MSGINIGTNFNYLGENFLDSRQGMPQHLSDLLDWNILVPEGFEVFVQGEWYIYRGANFWDNITGHWERQVSRTEYTTHSQDIDKLMWEVFPMTLEVSGGGNYEVGAEVASNMTWRLLREGQEYTPDSVKINDLDVEELVTPIVSDSSYVIKAWWRNKLFISNPINFRFYKRKYWGVSNRTSLRSEDIAELNSGLATSWTMGATAFNCSGGKYPYYLIPSSLYNPNTFRVWIGGLRNTDLEITTTTITNSYGITSEYTVIRLGSLQHGTPVISFNS